MTVEPQGQTDWPDVMLRRDLVEGADLSSHGKVPDSVGDLPCERIGRFRLLRSLGQGAMGQVVLAEDVPLARQVALKLMRRKGNVITDDDLAKQFLQEARAGAMIDHPNVVRVFEINVYRGLWYIAMEFCEGGSLQQRLESSGPLRIGDACQLLADAADGLAAAHARGIVHRDLKPANLLLTASGRCKINDFGLVWFAQSPTESGTRRVAGSPAFLAPEAIREGVQAPASDIYALGVSLFLMLTGRLPFEALTQEELLIMHLTAPIPDLKREADCSSQLVRLFERMMAKDPDRRPRARELAVALTREAKRSRLRGEASEFARRRAVTSLPSGVGESTQLLTVSDQLLPKAWLMPQKQKRAFLWASIGAALTLSFLILLNYLGVPLFWSTEPELVDVRAPVLINSSALYNQPE